MAGGNSDEFKNQLALAINGKRYRGENASEIQVNCIKCSIKAKTYRKMVIHYNEDTRELTRVFLEKKKLEKKRKASSDDDNDFEVLRHFKKRQVATYPIITL